MLNTYNIAITDGSVMVPVLSDNGSLMVYILSADPQDILGEYYCCMTTTRQLLDNYQTTIRQLPRNAANTPFVNNIAFGCIPKNRVQGAAGTTHIRIVASAATVNFDTEKYEHAMQGTAELPYNTDLTQAATLTLALPANSTDIVVAALGIAHIQYPGPLINNRPDSSGWFHSLTGG